MARKFAYDLSLTDIINAHNRISNIVRKTPLEKSISLSNEYKGDYWFKMENLQITGSFKLRGAANKILSLSQSELDAGLVCASAGNHAQAVAYMANIVGAHADIVVPGDTPQSKIDGVKRWGSNAIVYGDIYDEAQEYAYALCKKQGSTFIHAYLDPVTIAGQGTATLEALFDNPNFDTILVPAGGGGLMIGQAVAAKGINEDIRVIGIQTLCSPPWYYSFQDKILNNNVEFKPTIAEGLSGIIEEPNFTESLKCIDEIILVNEETVKKAMVWMLDRHHMVIEASSAVVIAAIMENAERFRNTSVLSILSGSSVDNSFIQGILK
jgi:Threonine dehydratase